MEFEGCLKKITSFSLVCCQRCKLCILAGYIQHTKPLLKTPSGLQCLFRMFYMSSGMGKIFFFPASDSFICFYPKIHTTLICKRNYILNVFISKYVSNMFNMFDMYLRCMFSLKIQTSMPILKHLTCWELYHNLWKSTGSGGKLCLFCTLASNQSRPTEANN